MAFVNENALNYFFQKLKEKFSVLNHSHSTATTTANGFMSSSDKVKLNGVATGATKNTLTQSTASLTVSGWSSNTQMITVNGVTASNLVIVTVPNDEYGITCTAQATNSLTFTCVTTPTVAVSVNVAILV